MLATSSLVRRTTAARAFSAIRTATFAALLLSCSLYATSAFAQLSGTKNIPGDYATLALAVTDLNTQGVGAPGVTFNLIAANAQTAPLGGYAITTLTGAAGAPIVFQGNGNTISAPNGQVVGSLNDAIFKLIGADYVTLTGFVMQENPANVINTPAASNNMTEFGVALFYTSLTDGSQNNTIQGNTISLNRVYLNTIGIYSNTRHSATVVTTSAEVTAASGSNSNNKVYTNTISNVNYGIVFIGAGTTIAAIDSGNDVGGASALTGNTITNWGGGATLTGYISLTGSNYCVFMNQQINDNFSFNTVTSAALAQAVTAGGFLKNYSVATPTLATFTSTINNNTVQVTNNPTAVGAGTVIGLNNQGLTPLVATVTMSMNNNTVQNSFVGGTTATTVGLTGITNFSLPGTINMTGNSVINNGITATTSTTGAVVGISNSGAAGTVNLNSNIVRSLTSSATTTGQVQGIANSGAVVTAININNNQLGNATSGFFSNAVASTGALFGVVNAGGAATALLTMQGNDIRGTVYSVLTAASQNYFNNQTFTGSTNISDNTITNITANTSGGVTMIGNSVTHAAGTTHNVNNNSIVTGFSKAAGTGTVAFYNSFGLSPASVTEINTGNNFSNVTLAGATPVIGWRSADGTTPGSRKTVTNNTFSNITGGTGAMTSVLYVGFADNAFAGNNVSGNTISNVTNGNSITAIFSDGQNQNFFSNTINGLSATGASAVVTAIQLGGGTTQNVFKNKIYDLQSNNATGTTNGILISAGTTFSVYNNLIGDLRAPATSSAADGVRGINVTSAAPTSNINVSFNTINLNASSSGTDFSTSGIFHTASTTASTAALNLRNNIIVNNSTPAGIGLTVAYRRSAGTAGTLANYGSSSDRNDFFAGTPSVTNLIYSDGTSTAQTITAYKGGVFTAGTVFPRDAASFSENPTFLSVTGSSVNFLHIDPAVATQIESGGAPIAGITDDFDGQARNAGTPDVGADEFNGIGVDQSPPAITYTALASTTSTANRTLTATIADATAVASGGNLPRIYFKKSTDAGYVSTACSLTSGTAQNGTYDCVINNALVGGGAVTTNEIVQYFIVAQDTLGNLGSNPPGASGVDVNTITFAGTPNSYTILPSISGNKTVGAGGDFATLAAAATAINSAVLTGPVTLSLIDPTYAGTFPVTINANTGSSSTNTITIKPAVGVTPTISGSSTSCLLIVNGADWVILDGSNTVGGTTRDLTMTNTSTGTSSAVVCLQTAAGPDGATNNMVKNTNLGGTTVTATPGTLFGVFSGSATISVSSAGTGNNNNTVQNNSITKTSYGVFSGGASAANKNSGTVIAQNVMNAATPNNITIGGILVLFDNGTQVTQNDISVLRHDGTVGTSGTTFGIAMGLVPSNTVTTFTGSDVTNSQVRRNRIKGVTQLNATGFSAFGIVINSVTSGTTLMSNNMISGVVAPSTASDFSGSIIAGGGTGSTTQVYYNSVSMTGLRGAGATFPAYGLAIGANNPIVDVRNNAFFNTQTSGSTGKSYAIATASTTFTNMTSNNNDLFVTGASGFVGQTGGLGTTGTDRATLSAWQTATGTDANSISADPLFVSTSDLHLQAASPVESAGTPVAVTIDFDGDPRPATKPEIGADELVSNLTITPTTVAFGNQLVATTSGEMTVTLANTGAGSLDVTTLTAAAAPFARTGTGTCAATLPITIAPGGSCTLTFTFAPTVAGAANQTLTVTSNGPGSGTITLTGTGTQGNLTISPTTVAFGNQVVGSTSSTMTVTLANTGNGSLDVTALTAAAAPFTRTGTGTCGPVTITIAAGGSCTLIYTFSPTAAVASNQTLTVTANAPGSGTITLSGTGTQGALTIAPTALTFGNQAVGSTSTAQTVTLGNSGNASLQVTALTPAAAPFAQSGGNCGSVPITLAAGASCTVSYTFAPSATGAANQTLTVTANAPGSGTIALSGTGIQGNLTISPTTVAFGNQTVGTTSSGMSVTLGNSGSASLQVTTVTAAAAPFALSGGTCGGTPITIAASGSCTLTYTFAPTATGAANQTLTVTADAPGSGTIALSGTGIQGTLTITPTSVNFGTQSVSTTSAESTVTLANTGNASLDVTTLTAAAAPFARTGTGTCSQMLPITVAPAASCTLTYTFTPTVTGPAGQTLTVTSSGAGSGTIGLSGTGAGAGGSCTSGMPIEVSASAGLAGPTGYGTLKAGFDAINAGVHQNNIAVAVCADTTELATAALNASGVGSSVYTAVMVAPANAGARTISGDLAAPLVDLNGADNVTIDGLNAGGNALTFSNTSAAATAGTSTIRFIGGATGNMVMRTTLLGSSTTTLATVGGGTVYFADDIVTTSGNDNNTISTNNIGPAGSNLPNKAIFGLGTSTTIGNANSGVVINNNRIYDFFNVGSSVSGIYVANGNDAWTISGNRIYQTAARIFTGTVLRYAGITLSQATAPRGSFTVISNRIGFGAADGTGTTTISGSTNTFRGIDAPNVDTTVATSIQGNTISGINQTTASTGTGTSSGFNGMMLGASGGRFDVGDVAGNHIGSLDGSSTIVVNSTAGTGLVYGMYDFSVNANTFANNRIGSITIQGVGGTNGFRGILLNTGSTLIGTVSGNTVANITNSQVGSYSLYGIQTLLTAATVTDNVVRNFTGNSNGGVVVMAGINVSAGTSTNPSLVARNAVHSLRNTVVGGASGAIYALDFTFPAQANIVERNLVHSISVDTTFVGYQVNGILMRGGTSAPSTTTFRNNMVRLGFDAAGAPITLPLGFTGIRDSAGTNVANNYYHNSVYIGGSGVTGGVALNVGSTAFSSDVITTTRNFQDNIFWNARSNVATGAALHIAIRAGGTTANPPGLTSNYNDLYATGNDGVTGVFNGFVVPTLPDWRTATGQDLNSFAENPQFIAPTGTAVTGDLHISPTIATPIEGTGTPIASVTNDYDGQARAGLTPTDIGADAGNFVPQIGNLTITPTALLFGQVGVGMTSSEMTVTLANTGSGSLQVTALTSATSPFARTATGSCSATLPITIAAGGSCTLTYTFMPTSNGPFNQTLTVTANAPGSGTIDLSGTGIQGNLSITPTNVEFGNQTVGTTSAAMPVTFTNIGNAPVTVTTLTAPASPFGIAPLAVLELPEGFTNCGAAPFTLAAGASCSIGYTFSPTATGLFTQMLTATSSGLGGGTITLSGTGVQGALTISPTTIDFGNQSVGTTSGASTVTLSNTGNATLNVTTLTPATSPFARLGGTCGGTPIAITAGGSCTLTYTFSPTASGPAMQTLTVTSDAPGSGTITLMGNGVQGTLVVSPTTVDFGSPDVFTTTQFMSVTLSNTGTGSLQVNSLTLAATPFQRTTDGTCGNSLPINIAAGASCTLTYKFAPTTAGVQSQNFTVSNNGSGGSGMFTLTGNGISDRIFRDGFDGPVPPEAE